MPSTACGRSENPLLYDKRKDLFKIVTSWVKFCKLHIYVLW